MTTTRTTPSSDAMTAGRFRLRATNLFRRGNPDAVAVGLTIKWTRQPVEVTWHDGSRGLSGSFTATAPGHRTRTITATWSPTTGLAVR